MKFVVIGLSVSSSWGNGHATTYRALLKELSKLGHDILFLEKDVPYYAANRDMPQPEFCRLGLYQTNEALKNDYEAEVANADVVIVGSYVKQGVEVGQWVTATAQGLTAFYDIDTPVTMAKLEKEDFAYIDPELIASYDLYLSFCGGPILKHLEAYYFSPAARPLYCSVDPDFYFPEENQIKWQLGYLGTYSTDRQPTLEELLNKTARILKDDQFVVAGPQYPEEINWPENVERIQHLPPSLHRQFYNQQRFTLNVTREDMINAGFSPSVRLFEAAACGVPIISDYWEGLTSLFEECTEILIARESADVQRYLKGIDDVARKRIGEQARQKVLKYHTAKARAKELVEHVKEAMDIRKKKTEKSVVTKT
ncbi:glycosyltransferase [Marivirga sp. S37H4]|uniref:Glycosyltransferase n=1 Tax=Marivirga aurantiaca TaxID=2802615 RepID=A0A934WY01_9BACT|nr:glycosyltransferase [Marivirga aurantiaca]MBK6264981.1 glycosyltransferase [Marivirga aurantiaca]